MSLVRADSGLLQYVFTVNGETYKGRTKTRDYDQALLIEAAALEDVLDRYRATGKGWAEYVLSSQSTEHYFQLCSDYLTATRNRTTGEMSLWAIQFISAFDWVNWLSCPIRHAETKEKYPVLFQQPPSVIPDRFANEVGARRLEYGKVRSRTRKS